jgi:hypothetical protein
MLVAWCTVRTLVMVVTRYTALTTIPRTGRNQLNLCNGEASIMRRKRGNAVCQCCSRGAQSRHQGQGLLTFEDRSQL